MTLRPDDDLSLSDLDFLGDPEQLRRDALESARTSGADLRPGQPKEASDSTGAVYVAVDHRGGVIDIGFSTSWRERLKPSEVGVALYDAYLAAVQKAQAAAAIAALEGGGQELPQPQPGRYEPEDNHRWIERTWQELDQIEADRRRYAEAGARAQTTPDQYTRVSSPDGYLKIQLQGRHIVGVEVDARRIAGASIDGLANDALTAFETAQGVRDGQ
ncbi:MAG: hypothetical protein JWP76_3064 [Dactylosporangium sp.]|nr:hypothetical protein [Dactylosporangium sp.]